MSSSPPSPVRDLSLPPGPFGWNLPSCRGPSMHPLFPRCPHSFPMRSKPRKVYSRSGVPPFRSGRSPKPGFTCSSPPIRHALFSPMLPAQNNNTSGRCLPPNDLVTTMRSSFPSGRKHLIPPFSGFIKTTRFARVPLSDLLRQGLAFHFPRPVPVRRRPQSHPSFLFLDFEHYTSFPSPILVRQELMTFSRAERADLPTPNPCGFSWSCHF